VTSPAFKSARMRAWSTWAISENANRSILLQRNEIPDNYATVQLTKG
jgi:hypothetical protein